MFYCSIACLPLEKVQTDKEAYLRNHYCNCNRTLSACSCFKKHIGHRQIHQLYSSYYDLVVPDAACCKHCSDHRIRQRFAQGEDQEELNKEDCALRHILEPDSQKVLSVEKHRKGYHEKQIERHL